MIEKVEQIEKRSKKPVDLSIDTEVVTKILTGFIADCIHKTASKKAVIGLSGGLDSSVVAALAVRALGADRVLESKPGRCRKICTAPRHYNGTNRYNSHG